MNVHSTDSKQQSYFRNATYCFMTLIDDLQQREGCSPAWLSVFEEIFYLCFKETESEPEDNLDDLEKHLREKALRSMRKAQVSPPSQAESFDIMYILFGLYSEFNFKLLNVFELQNITFVVIIARLRFTMYKGHGFTLQKVSTVYQ